MPIYSRTGDRGETALPGGIRVAKDAAMLEAVGTIDELNPLLGLVLAEPLPEDVDRLLKRLQGELFAMSADLTATDGPARIGPENIALIEEAIDRYEEQIEPLAKFILPGGTRSAATLHVARTVCRRAERRLVALGRDDDLLAYTNRLGDLLFVLARAANAAAGQADVAW